MSMRTFASLVAAALLLPACDSEEGMTPADGDQMRVCEAEDRDDAYAVGLQKSGASITIALMDASPAPPDRGDNDWVIRVSDPDDAPMTDAIIEVTPWMPDHGHGTGVGAVVTPTESDGEYTVAPVNLFMAGLWEVTFDVTMPDDTTDEVTFSFCVEP